MNEKHTVPLFVVPVLLAMMALLGMGWLVEQTKAEQSLMATTWHVSTDGDDANSCLDPANACATIAGAVNKANDGDTIQIAPGTYYEHDVNISKQLTVTGASAETTIVDGGQNGRVFSLLNHITLRHLTVQNGLSPPDSNLFVRSGGGVRVGTGAQVLIQHVIVRDNTSSGSGGGIFNHGFMTLDQSVVISNTSNAGSGGGIYHYNVPGGAITITHSLIAENLNLGNSGGGISTGRPLLIRDSVIRDNVTTSAGGGIYADNAQSLVQLERVTITGNRSATSSALFVVVGAHATLDNVTASGNVATTNWAGIRAAGATSQITVTNSTIAYNQRLGSTGVGRNGVVVSSDAKVTLANTIVAHNDERQCSTGDIISAGHNLSSDTYCDFTEPGDLQNVNALLMPLGDYGGPTPTHALQPGSPAIDTGSNDYCLSDDQRGVARPYDGDNSGTAVCDIGAVEAEHQLTIADVSVLEGTNGMTTAVFTVTLSPDHNQTVTVDYATEDGTAVSPDDYTAVSGTLTFTPGTTEQTIEVPIVANNTPQPDRIFYVNLNNASNAFILIDRATGTIIDDDGLPGMSINDVSILEGNSGSQELVFAVTLSRDSSDTITVNYATMDDTAVAPDDYTASNGTLTFNPGQTYKEIRVTILGDIIDEGVSEQFFVQLADVVNAELVKDVGIGTIIDDDTAQLRHQPGPSVVKPPSGQVPAVFEVTLDTPAAFPITVDYTVSDGFGDNGAKYGIDYTGAITGTLTFPPGTTFQTYTLFIIGNTEAGPDKVFSSTLSNGTVPIVTSTAIATIINDPDAFEGSFIYLPLIVRP
jgi:hypothetical protein